MAISNNQRDTTDIIDAIRQKADAYAPEWKFDMEQPDMGTVLAVLFADMMEGTIKQFRRLPDNYQLQFYNLLGENLLPAREAKGYVTFSTVNDEVSGAYVKEGTRVLGDTGEGEKIAFETKEGLYVSPAELKSLYYVNGGNDYISVPLSLPIAEQQKHNQQSHIFYIGHATAFCIKTEGEIMLDFHLLREDFGTESEQFFMNRITWYYYSTEGFVEFPDFRYEEGKVYLYKKRNMPAFKQTEIEGKESYWLKLEADCLKAETCISFQRLTVSASGHYLIPEIIYDGNMELDMDCFMPFGERPYPYAEIYISSEEIFSQKGAWIQMNFELEFMEIPSELKSPDIPINWRGIMHQSEFREPEPVDILISSVIWEYYNGYGWTRIPDTGCYETLFSEKYGKKKITIKFRCPEDMYPFLLSAKQSNCIRIRISKMINLYAMDGIYIVPQIRHLTMHYWYEKEEMFPHYAYAVNRLRTKSVCCSQEFTPFYNLFPNREMLYMSFSRPLKEAEICILFVLEKDKRNLQVQYRYECYGKNGWQVMKVEDDTLHLSKTGLVTLYREHIFERHEFFGCEGYWLRIVQETEEKVSQCTDFSRITGIYINSTAVCAGKKSGANGNLLPEMIQTMDRSIGYINKVTNYRAMAGGYDEETMEQAVKRVASALRHQERAVTAKDYEDVVKSSVRNILQVRCFPGRDAEGKKAPGHITLTVLPEKKRDYNQYFENMKEDIYQCLLPHMNQQIYQEKRLHIVEPEWISLNLYMTIVARDSRHLYQLKEKINQRINAFLDPVSGNFDGKGWKIGTLPTMLQIQNLCSQMEEILYVKNISLKDEGHKSCYVLGIGGEHEIEVIPE